MKIKLDSRYLKVGDKIIRTKPVNEYNSLFVNNWAEVIKKTPTHIEVRVSYAEKTDILEHEKWNDGNWVRWK